MKKILLSVFLCLTCALSCFMFFGCSNIAKPGEVATSYEEVERFYEEKDNIFGANNQLNFGNAQSLVDSANQDYSVLKTKYNSIFSISNDYIKEYMTYVRGLQENQLTEKVQVALSGLNSAISAYFKELKSFAIQHEYFAERDFSSLENSRPFLQSYKIYLGKMVAKNVEVSDKLARVLEEGKIYDIIKTEESALIEDVVVIKTYIRAKLLPVYTRFLITETESNVSWTTSDRTTEAAQRIDDAIDAMLLSYNNDYQIAFVVDTTPNAESVNNVQALMQYCEDFMVEAQDFYKALSGLKISILAKNYKNDLTRYQNKNKLAEIYLEKIEQFINISLKNFIKETKDLIF